MICTIVTEDVKAKAFDLIAKSIAEDENWITTYDSIKEVVADTVKFLEICEGVNRQ